MFRLIVIASLLSVLSIPATSLAKCGNKNVQMLNGVSLNIPCDWEVTGSDSGVGMALWVEGRRGSIGEIQYSYRRDGNDVKSLDYFSRYDEAYQNGKDFDFLQWKPGEVTDIKKLREGLYLLTVKYEDDQIRKINYVTTFVFKEFFHSEFGVFTNSLNFRTNYFKYLSSSKPEFRFKDMTIDYSEKFRNIVLDFANSYLKQKGSLHFLIHGHKSEQPPGDWAYASCYYSVNKQDPPKYHNFEFGKTNKIVKEKIDYPVLLTMLGKSLYRHWNMNVDTHKKILPNTLRLESKSGEYVLCDYYMVTNSYEDL